MINAAEYISSISGCVNKERIWLPSSVINALLFCDKEYKIHYYSKFDNCKKKEWKIKKCIVIDKRVLFISSEKPRMWVLDTESMSIKSLMFSRKESMQIVDAIMAENSIWMIPKSFQLPLVRMDMNTYMTEEIAWGNEDVYGKDSTTFTKLKYENGNIVFATRMQNQIYLCKININTEEFASEHIDDMEWVNCVGIHGDKIWMLGKDSKKVNVIYECETKKLTIGARYVAEGIENLSDSLMLKYSDMFIYDDTIFCAPAYAHGIYIYDFEMCLGRVVNCVKKEYDDNKGAPFGAADVFCGRMYLFPRFSNSIIEFDLDTKRERIHNLQIEEKEMSRILKNQEIICESRKKMLKSWIKGICI